MKDDILDVGSFQLVALISEVSHLMSLLCPQRAFSHPRTHE